MAVGDTIRRLPARNIIRGGRLIRALTSERGEPLTDETCEGWLVHTVKEEPVDAPVVLLISWEQKP